VQTSCGSPAWSKRLLVLAGDKVVTGNFDHNGQAVSIKTGLDAVNPRAVISATDPAEPYVILSILGQAAVFASVLALPL
jgi:hypothetical protein